MIYGATSACAINVLQENAALRLQLNNLSNKQQNENRRNILYYRGRSSYSGIVKTPYSSYSQHSKFEQKNIYEKKGVKFKIDTQKQEEKLKEFKENEKVNNQTPTSIDAKSANENAKVETKPIPQQQKTKRNDDAE